MKEQLTNEFSVVHATVHYPDGTTENVEYAKLHRHGSQLQLLDIGEEWSASYSNYSNEARLSAGVDPESEQIFSTQNFRKIETNWTQEFVAVAEVEIVEEREGILRKTKSVADGSKEPDVTIYEKHEWEAMEEE